MMWFMIAFVIGMSSFVSRGDVALPLCQLVPGAEYDRGAFACPSLHNSQQIVGFLRGKVGNQPFIHDQKINLPVDGNYLFKGAASLGDIQLTEQLWHPDVAHRFEFPACSMPKALFMKVFPFPEAPFNMYDGLHQCTCGSAPDPAPGPHGILSLQWNRGLILMEYGLSISLVTESKGQWIFASFAAVSTSLMV